MTNSGCNTGESEGRTLTQALQLIRKFRLILEDALYGQITSLGIHYRFTGNLYGGMEAIGEDLEGLWEEDEAEGGAKIMLGPSLNLAPSHSYFSFSLSGGPVMYVTRSPVTNPNAIRELPSENGLTLRARIIYTI